MTNDLTKISGIGANSAANLNTAGFETVESIANASIEDLGKVSGFGPGRAERVISKAKEMTESAEFTEIPVVTERVASETATETVVETETKADVVVVRRFAFLRAPRVLLSTAAAIVLFIFAAIYFDLLGGIQSISFPKTLEEITVDSQTNEPQSYTQQTGQQSAQQQSQMQKFQAQVQQQKARSEQFKAQAEQRAQQSWEQFLAKLPPAQAQQVIQQRAIADRQIAAAKARHAEFLRQHKARVEARSGTRFGS